MLMILAQEGGGGGAATTQLLFLLAMAALFYFLLIRPQQRRARAQRELVRNLEVGDEVMTNAGIFGTIRDMDDEVVAVEISPGTTVRMIKGAIARRLVEEPGGEAGRGP